MQMDFEEYEDATLDVLNEEDEIDIAALERSSEEAPVVKLANVVLVDASDAGHPIFTSSHTRRIPHSIPY